MKSNISIESLAKEIESLRKIVNSKHKTVVYADSPKPKRGRKPKDKQQIVSPQPAPVQQVMSHFEQIVNVINQFNHGISITVTPHMRRMLINLPNLIRTSEIVTEFINSHPNGFSHRDASGYALSKGCKLSAKSLKAICSALNLKSTKIFDNQASCTRVFKGNAITHTPRYNYYTK